MRWIWLVESKSGFLDLSRERVGAWWCLRVVGQLFLNRLLSWLTLRVVWGGR